MSEMKCRRGRSAGSLVAPFSAEEVDAEAGPKVGPPEMVQPLRARRDYGASCKKVSDDWKKDILEDFKEWSGGWGPDEVDESKVMEYVKKAISTEAPKEAPQYLLYLSRKGQREVSLRGADLSRTASDAMGFLALQMAEEHIDMRWTTAEKGWKVQAKKNLMLAKENWNAGAERMEYVFKTFAKVTEPGFDIKRIDSAITVTVSEQSKEL